MKQLFRPFLLAAVVASSTWVASAQAEDFRVGFVNLDRILREANTAKAAQTKLEQEFSKREKEINDLANTLRTNNERFEREAPTLSETQRQTRQRQLIEQNRDLDRKRREFQEDLAARKNEELQQLLERANRVVKQVAETEKYDLVIQEAVYISPKHDITEKVIRALNAPR